MSSLQTCSLCVLYLLIQTTVVHPVTNEGFERSSRWSACAATCRYTTEPVYMYRVRRCIDSQLCTSDLLDKIECNLPERSCPVDGNWSGWTNWTKCSQSCGGGEQHRTRTCTSPVASNGGLQCSGNHEEINTCNPHPCPVNHVLSPWTVWTLCQYCDSSPRHRIKTCTPPLHGGTPCPRSLKEYSKCPIDVERCPVDGGFSEWSAWDKCFLPPCSLVNGTTTRRRSCTNPRPQRNGRDCEGAKKEQQMCSTWKDACPVDGIWNVWSAWDNQPDGVSQVRARTCQGVKNNGKPCEGESTQTRDIPDIDDVSGNGSGSGSGNGNDDAEDGSGSGVGSGVGSGNDLTDDTEHRRR